MARPAAGRAPEPARRPSVRDTLGPDLADDEELAHAATIDARRPAPSADREVPSRRAPATPALPTPPPAPAHAMGEALELLDPGLPIGLFERLLETVSTL